MMKQLLSVIAILFVAVSSYGQVTIKLEDVPKHIGDSVTVCGRVAGGRYMENLENSPTFLNLGAAYPNQLLSLVIWKDQRTQFEPAAEVQFLEKNVCVTGKIILSRERPSIVILKKEQIQVSK